MTAKERLYLTSDQRRVVEHGNLEAAFLLAAQGAEIKPKFIPLVEAFYASRSSPQPDRPTTEATAPPPTGTADEIEGYETRIPTNIRRRGRPRKTPQASGPEV